jgi:hypothetical protein
LPFFAGHRRSQITIRESTATATTRFHEGRRQARTINMTLALLAQIVEVAVEYRHPATR